MSNSATPRKPKEVLAVFRALLANAKEAGVLRRLVSCTYQPPGEFYPTGEWRVGDNWESGFDTMIFRDGQWFYRDPGTGSDHPMKGGLEEALANCSCRYTG